MKSERLTPEQWKDHITAVLWNAGNIEDDEKANSISDELIAVKRAADALPLAVEAMEKLDLLWRRNGSRPPIDESKTVIRTALAAIKAAERAAGGEQ